MMSKNSSLRLKKFEEWDKTVKDNLDDWVGSFSKKLKEGKDYWDFCFFDFVELSLFKNEFKDMIDKAVVLYKQDTGETNIDYDLFAYALLKEQQEEAEDILSSQKGIA